MKQQLYGFIALTFLISNFLLSACHPSNVSRENRISTDEDVIGSGQVMFQNHCSGCHSFVQDGIGPHLGGLTEEVNVGWIRDFIQNPAEMINSEDQRAKEIFGRFESYMPPFDHLPNEEIDAIIAYMHQYPEPDDKVVLRTDEIDNPIPEPIPLSGWVVELELMHQFPASSEEMPITRINKLDYRPDTKQLFMLDLRGKLYQLEEGTEKVYLDMATQKPDFIPVPGLATGFGSFAFHPEFSHNGLLYTTHTEPAGTGPADFSYADSIKTTLQWVLSEWKTQAITEVPFVGNSRELFRIDMFSGVHGVQEITFNPKAQPG
ncbi:cytochrome c, partial [Aquiflexum sp.]|uniref:c-type cytochrome n=1 Tax=Aquiflexum sp. TaxID=1872584 RepID=UPI0035940D2F